MKNGKGNIVTRTVDGRSAPIHVVTVKNIEKSNENEPDEVSFSVIKDGRKYRVMYSCPIMGLEEWLSPFHSKADAIHHAEQMAEYT